MYEPDRWIVIEVDGLQKILAAWIGGYLGSDDWRLSSGITQIEENEDFFTIKNYSGSVYKCHKQKEGMTYLTSSIYRSFKEATEDNGKTLKIVSLTKQENNNEQ